MSSTLSAAVAKKAGGGIRKAETNGNSNETLTGSSKKAVSIQEPKRTVPKGYGMYNGELWSREAFTAAHDLQLQSDEKNPALKHLFVHADFAIYGIYDTIEDAIGKFAIMLEKAPMEKKTWFAFEGLVMYLASLGDDLSRIDDGEHYTTFVRLLGALCVQYIESLELGDNLSDDYALNLSFVIQKFCAIGDFYNRDIFRTGFPDLIRIVLCRHGLEFVKFLVPVAKHADRVAMIESIAMEDRTRSLQLLISEDDLFDEEDDRRQSYKFQFARQWAYYKKHHTNGGRDIVTDLPYNITKWGPKQRATYTCDAEDLEDDY